jgi:hypothetical protein
MQELGHDKYTMRLRHFVLRPNETVQIEAWQEYYVMTAEACDASISSDFGLFDMSADYASEMQYEHQGLITVKNNSDSAAVHIRFIQVIPN